MPRIPKTLPAQLRQYYKTAPRPASAYGDDVFNFAADRLGRRNRAMRDLEDLDRYAMEQQARGRYNPDELNALARQIEADRMLSEMQFNEYFDPRYEAADRRAKERARMVSELADWQRAYTNLNAEAEGVGGYWTGTGYMSNARTSPENSDFAKLSPYLGKYATDGTWQENADLSPDVLLDDIGGYGLYPDAMDYERAQAPLYENDELLGIMMPDDTGPFMTHKGVKNIHDAISRWERRNRDAILNPPKVKRFGTDISDWHESLGKKRYR